MCRNWFLLAMNRCVKRYKNNLMNRILKCFSRSIIVLALVFMGSLIRAQVVTNAAELSSAIQAASPGATIILANGTWNNTFININKNGTAAAPITITAQNVGSVLMTGNSRVYMSGSHITVSGLVFQNPANLISNSTNVEPVFELGQCDHCKVINNKIDAYNGTTAQRALKHKWVLSDGEYIEIAYNSFLGKNGIGSIINDNRNSSAPDYLAIHHNYFADRTPLNVLNADNDQDAIRIGNSSTSLFDSFTEVHDNYFFNFFGEIEIISNKSGQNRYYNNTFRKYSGCLTLRHGDNCEVFGNYFFAENNLLSAGVRVIGEGHKVYNNYIEGVNSTKPDNSTSNATGGINITNGRLNSALNGYYQVKNAQIVNNTFVDCDYGIRIGTKVSSDLDQEPVNLTLANNIMQNTSVDPFQTVTTPSGTYVNQGNITNLPNATLVDDGNFHRLTSGSVPINANAGTYSFLTMDILGGSRNATADAGAEEFGANGTSFPYTSADVGVSIGFGALIVTNPNLNTSVPVINFGNDAGTVTFDVVSNVGWEITESMSWLSLDVYSGFGTTTVTATLTENTTGTTRAGDIYLDEVPGGSNLADTLPVMQLNTFITEEIPIVGTSGLGMQMIPTVAEINAYNDDLSNYWTGNPDTEPEVSITFDLECVHELTEIGIHFWKADERTTTFSIALADVQSGPFTTVISAATSAASGVTVNTEQIFSLLGYQARYVKFIGIGNSSATNWTSIANVNIYGNLGCEGVTATPEFRSVGPRVSIFPVPVSGGLLNVATSAPSMRLEGIRVYNAMGQKVLVSDGRGAVSKRIDVSGLKAGVYFIALDNIGTAKFVIR